MYILILLYTFLSQKSRAINLFESNFHADCQILYSKVLSGVPNYFKHIVA